MNIFWRIYTIIIAIFTFIFIYLTKFVSHEYFKFAIFCGIILLIDELYTHKHDYGKFRKGMLIIVLIILIILEVFLFRFGFDELL